jgi:methyl-accepting chemotaxis protein
MASTAEELSGQSEQLQELIAFFRTGESGRVRGRKAIAGRVGTALPNRQPQAPETGRPVAAGGNGRPGGVALDLGLLSRGQGGDRLDEEFERF